MKNIVFTIMLTILFSLMYFEVEFYALPGINTKMIIALMGLATFFVKVLLTQDVYVPKLIFGIFLISLIFSLVCFVSVVYNNTDDFVYATYFAKMSVWFFGAYFVMNAIKYVHGCVTFQLLFHYLALLCVMQCVLALMIDNMPAFEEFLMRTIIEDYDLIERGDRLYGIGASFDTVGVRFTPALIGLVYLMMNNRGNKALVFYMVLWAIIVVVGSAMSRTTSIGAIVSLVYLLFNKISFGSVISYRAMKVFVGSLAFVFVVSLLLIYCYNNIPIFREYMEFGFQNFFNYSRTGEFTSNSTENLKGMFILPDNLKTWIIGDALFDVPGGFYMATDVGYLRFIFYCGLVGFISFLSLFIFCTVELCKKWSNHKSLFVMLLVWQLLAWIKISTDIFVVFALLALVPVANGANVYPLFRTKENSFSYDS